MKDYRRDLIGHKNGDVTDLYCANELTRKLENAKNGREWVSSSKRN